MKANSSYQTTGVEKPRPTESAPSSLRLGACLRILFPKLLKVIISDPSLSFRLSINCIYCGRFSLIFLTRPMLFIRLRLEFANNICSVLYPPKYVNQYIKAAAAVVLPFCRGSTIYVLKLFNTAQVNAKFPRCKLYGTKPEPEILHTSLKKYHGFLVHSMITLFF